MKKILIFITLISLSTNAFAQCERPYSSLVFAQKNKAIIYEKRAEELIYPASLTKVMTLYLTFEAIQKHKLQLQQKIKISANVEDVGKVNKVTRLGLKEGDKISVEEAIKGTAIKSFNETAVALAEAVAGTEWKFVEMMNKKAHELKMDHTNFRNASGLHDPGQYTTGYDLARLVMAIEKNFPAYRKYFSMKQFAFRGTKYKTHNHVLLEYKGATGFKTGYTVASGFNLIASAKRGNALVNSILTGCETYQARDEFTKDLLDAAFKNINRAGKEIVVVLK